MSRLVCLSHHGFRLGFGIRSCCSMMVWIVCWMFWKCLSVVVYSCELLMICVIAASICGIMMCLFLLYRAIDSVGVVLACFLFVLVWNIVYVGRWSDSGGEIVPAVVGVCVSVVSTWSISVLVLWCGSYLVGVVIVVYRLFSIRK